MASFLIFAENNAEAAQDVIREAFAQSISSPTLFWLLARAMQLAGAAVPEIVEVADRCLNTHVDEPSGWMMAGQILELIDQTEAAEDTYRKVIASHRDDNGFASLLLGQLLGTVPNRIDEAEQALRTAIEKGQGKYCGPLKDLAELLVHRGDDAQADDLVADALRINTRCHCSLLLKGDIAIRKQDAADAQTLYRRAIEIEPQNIKAYTALARISEPHEAAELIESAREIAPEHPLVLLARGRLIGRSLTERMKDVRDAVDCDPDLVEAKLELATLYARHGKGEDIAPLLADVLPTLPSRRELIPAFVDSAIEIANLGETDLLEQVLEGPGGTSLEPILIALKMHRGERPVVAKEVLEVAGDILARMRDR